LADADRPATCQRDRELNTTTDSPQRPREQDGGSHILRQACEKLDEAKALLLRIGIAPRAVPAPSSGTRQVRYLMVSNGHKRVITEDELATIDPTKFAFFLNQTSGQLLTSATAKRPGLRSIAESGMQSEDVTLLAFLVEHPNRYFGVDNLSQFLEGQEMLAANTLSRRLVRIRRAVQQGNVDGPFIRKVLNAASSVSRSGFAVYFDASSGSYCLVRYAGPDET
jgi:hypothetical protein